MGQVILMPAPARLLLRSDEWTPESALLTTALLLICVALPAWVALSLHDAHGDLTIWPKRWASFGQAPFVLFAIMVAFVLGPRFALTPEQLRPYAYKSIGTFIVDGEVAWVWLLAWMTLSLISVMVVTWGVPL